MPHRRIHVVTATLALAALAGGCSDATGSDVVVFARVADVEVPERVPAGTPFTVRFAYEATCGVLERMDVKHGAAETTIAVVTRLRHPVNACPDILHYEPVTITVPAPATSRYAVRFRQPGGDDISILTVVGEG